MAANTEMFLECDDEATPTSGAEEEMPLQGGESPPRARSVWKFAALAAVVGLVVVAGAATWWGHKGTSGGQFTSLFSWYDMQYDDLHEAVPEAVSAWLYLEVEPVDPDPAYKVDGATIETCVRSALAGAYNAPALPKAVAKVVTDYISTDSYGDELHFYDCVWSAPGYSWENEEEYEYAKGWASAVYHNEYEAHDNVQRLFTECLPPNTNVKYFEFGEPFDDWSYEGYHYVR